ncbi:MAG: hypothetical protein E3J72_08340 [Planctomycetota bacterium]|nr:MAG: hypothetical protein E3J72_08340 [Planctomycetota bacterium]
MDIIDEETLRQVVQEIVRANPTVFPPPFNVLAREELWVEPSSETRTEEAAHVFRDGKSQVLTVERRVLAKFYTVPKPHIVIHQGSLEVDDDVEPAIAIADNLLLAAWRITEDLIFAANKYFVYRRKKKRFSRSSQDEYRPMELEEFRTAVYGALERNTALFPKWLVDKLDRGLGVRTDTGNLDGQLILGWFTQNQYGRGIDIFHGSFLEIHHSGYGMKTVRDFEAGILGVLVHEFVHHAGSCTGYDHEARFEWQRNAFKRQELSPEAEKTHRFIMQLFILAVAIIMGIILFALIRAS